MCVVSENRKTDATYLRTLIKNFENRPSKLKAFVRVKLLNINLLSTNFTKWSNKLKLFECVWPFCGIGA